MLPTVGTEHKIAGQQVTIAGDKGRQLRAANLLLAFKKELHIDRQGPLALEQGLNAQDRRKHVPLIVSRAACIYAIFDNCGFKGRMIPELQRVYRLSVEMPIDQHRRLARGVEPFSIDNRMPPCGQDLHFLQASGLHASRYPLSRVLDIAGMRGQRRNTGNTEKLQKLILMLRLMLYEVRL